MPISKDQYEIVANRRLATDGMLWQTPVLSLTAQAFLFSIALGSDIAYGARLVTSILALVAALASIQLMVKHRYHEVKDSKRLQKYEQSKSGYKVIHISKSKNIKYPWYIRMSSYHLWLFMLSIFGIGALGVIIGVITSWEWLIGS